MCVRATCQFGQVGLGRNFESVGITVTVALVDKDSFPLVIFYRAHESTKAGRGFCEILVFIFVEECPCHATSPSTRLPVSRARARKRSRSACRPAARRGLNECWSTCSKEKCSWSFARIRARPSNSGSRASGCTLILWCGSNGRCAAARSNPRNDHELTPDGANWGTAGRSRSPNPLQNDLLLPGLWRRRLRWQGLLCRTGFC